MRFVVTSFQIISTDEVRLGLVWQSALLGTFGLCRSGKDTRWGATGKAALDREIWIYKWALENRRALLVGEPRRTTGCESHPLPARLCRMDLG